MATKNRKNSIIVGLKNGFNLNEVLTQAPSDVMGVSGTGERVVNFPLSTLSAERLHSIAPEVQQFKIQNANNATIESADDELLFQQEIYPQKSEDEQKLYRTYKVEVPDGISTEDVINNLKNQEGVDFVQKDEMNSLYLHPNDTLLSSLYGLKKMKCESAWDLSKGKDVIIAVLDTGVDYKHPDISANMWQDSFGNFGFDFSDEDANPMDFHGHGSHCAGTIAAVGNNSLGVIGVAFSARIMAIKIFPNAFDSIIAKALKFAVDNGAKILSNSWGPTSRRPSNPVVEQAIDYVYAKGGIVIFAAGNNNDDVQFYSPANYPKVISVGATDRNDARASFSNFGPLVTVAAPGVDILSLRFNTPDYTLKSGTSMACPHVAGLAALLISQRPDLSFESVRDCIKNNVDAINPDQPVGSGRVNAFKALSAIQP